MNQAALFDDQGRPADSARPLSRVEEMLDRAHRLDLPAAFIRWLPDNWAIWREFVSLADDARHRGRSHYAARTIIEVLRWHSGLREEPVGEFKINDHFTPHMARLYNDVKGVDFFEIRTRGSDE
jgi:hypothetical protein